MSEEQSTRRNFLKIIGLSAGASMVGTSTIASFVNHSEIQKLNTEQLEFMLRYGTWMDDFTEVVRVQKTEPDNHENNMKMISLTTKAEELQPELSVFMKDETFSLIYLASIKRLSDEI